MTRWLVVITVMAGSVATFARADEVEDKAAKVIEASGGKVQRDKGKPGKVIAITLGPKAGEAEIKALADLKNLLAITLSGPAVTDVAAKEIGTHTTLVQVIATDAKGLTDAGVAELAGLKNLKQLALVDATGVSGKGLKELAAVPNLAEFAFTGGKITDDELKAVAGCKKLTKVTIGGTKSDATDAGVKALTGLAELETLSVIVGPGFTDAGMKDLAAVKNLTSLTIYRATKVTDAGLREIAALKKLTALSIEADMGVTDAGMKPLAELANLTTLAIASRRMTGTGLKDLAALKLTHLYLNLPKCSDTGLKSVGAFKGLTLFQLYNGTGVTPAGLKELADLGKLTSLDLSYCGVTDAGLKELASLKDLTTLTLTGTKVTAKGLKDFTTAVPKCKLVK